MGKQVKRNLSHQRLEFFEKSLANNFALSDAEGDTSGPFNSGCIKDLLLLRTLLAIHQKSWQPRFISYSSPGSHISYHIL